MPAKIGKETLRILYQKIVDKPLKYHETHINKQKPSERFQESLKTMQYFYQTY